MKPVLKDAYQLLHKGGLALARAEENGIKIDVPYLKGAVEDVTAKARRLTRTLRSDPIWKTWVKRYKDKANLNSRPQLAGVFYDVLGFPRPPKTSASSEDNGSKAGEADEAAFRGIDLPFVGQYFRRQKLLKLRKTYLLGVLSEVCEGYLHPSFNLHTVQTYRSSSSDPNFHNIPIRDKELGPIIRKAFVGRWHLVEVDLSGAEVRVSYCYNKDKNLGKYLTDPKTDMHRDTAADLLCLPVEFLVQHKDWAKKGPRDWAKNRFVFPQFYGSVFFQCAPHIWEALVETGADGKPRNTLPDGTGWADHLRGEGIHSLGACDPRRPAAPGTFEYHVRKVERILWQERFPEYTAWKERWYNNYRAKGYFDTFTGFRCAGVFKRNQVLNYPIQGSAFHILLWSLIKVQDWLDRYHMETKIVGQIHDSLILDVPPAELQDVLNTVHQVMTVLCPRHWDWVTIPIEVEAEVAPLGATWNDKRQWIPQNGGGVWAPKAA